VNPALTTGAAVVAAHTRHATLGFIGQDRVDVTELNVALESADPAAGSQ